MTDPNQTPLPQNVPPSPFSPLTPEQQQQQQQQQQPPQQQQHSSPSLLLMQQHLAALTTLVNNLAQEFEANRNDTEARFSRSQQTQHDLTTHVTDIRKDQTTIITDIQRIRNDMSNQQAMGTVVQSLDTVIRQFLSTLQSSPTPQPAASPITLSPADVQNAMKDGLLAFWQNASSQGMSPSQTVAATGITPATQGQPPTQVVTTAPAQTKKLMLGSIFFGHLNPDDLPSRVVENYFFTSDKVHQNWIKKNTLSHFISPHYGLAQYAKQCNCPIRFEDLLHNTIDGFYIMKPEFNAQYEAIFASAPTVCPTWLDVPADHTPAYVVCKDRIYALGPDGKQYYEAQLQLITPQFPPDPSRDMNQCACLRNVQFLYRQDLH